MVKIGRARRKYLEDLGFGWAGQPEGKTDDLNNYNFEFATDAYYRAIGEVGSIFMGRAESQLYWGILYKWPNELLNCLN